MGDRDAVREAGRAARILQIADLVGVRRRQIGARRFDFGEAVPVARGNAALRGGSGGEFGELGREQEQLRVRARQHHDELFDISVAPAEAGRQRQRHGPQPGIDGAEEAGREFGAGLGDQREAVALGEAHARRSGGHGRARRRADRNRDRRARACRARRGNSSRAGRWRHNRALRRRWRSRRCGAAGDRASGSCLRGQFGVDRDFAVEHSVFLGSVDPVCRRRAPAWPPRGNPLA